MVVNAKKKSEEEGSGPCGKGCKLCQFMVETKDVTDKRGHRGHRADLRGEDSTKPAFHFKQEGHTSEDMGVVVIEEVKGKDDMYRVTRERFWINCLGTYNEENKRK